MPFIDDCGKFPTDCFIFHKQNTTLKLNSQFFLLRIEKKISAFESMNMALFLQSKKFQRLSLIYHSRTFWFQILRYNPDYTLLFLYAYIACTSIVPWRGCHCSSDICKKPDWITLQLCHTSACHAGAQPHVASLFLYLASGVFVYVIRTFSLPTPQTCSLHIVIWLCQSSDFLILNIHLTIPGLPHFHVKLGVNLPVFLRQAARIQAGGTHQALSTSLLTECLSSFTLLFHFSQQGFEASSAPWICSTN